MIINKVTVGFVIQQFDTKKKKFVHQSFVAGDQCDYETETGDALSNIETESFGIGPNMGSKEPYLPFDMVQPCETPFVGSKLKKVKKSS